MTASDVRDRIRAVGGKRAYIGADVFRTHQGLHEFYVGFDFADKRIRGNGDTWALAMADAELQIPNALPDTGEFSEVQHGNEL